MCHILYEVGRHLLFRCKYARNVSQAFQSMFSSGYLLYHMGMQHRNANKANYNLVTLSVLLNMNTTTCSTSGLVYTTSATKAKELFARRDPVSQDVPWVIIASTCQLEHLHTPLG
jgi:hypothetical protein